MLDVRRLRYFAMIARLGSMAGASRALNVAQPSLSHHISELEQAFGAPLFVRFSRGVKLTELGERLQKHAERILGAVEEAEIDLASFARKNAPQRALRLGLLPSWGASLAPAIIAATAERLPWCMLGIVELRNDEAIKALDDGKVDMAVILSPNQWALAVPIVREPLMFICGYDAGPFLSLKELAGRDLILPSPVNQLRCVVDEAAASIGIQLNPVMEIDGQDTIKGAIEAGVGGSIMSWNSVRSECLAGSLYASRITDPDLFRDVYFGVGKTMDRDIAEQFFSILSEISSR